MMEALSTIRPRAQSGGGPLRMPVQGVYRFDHRRVIVGRIEAGRIRTGDSIALFPGNRRSEVKSLESWNTPRITEACAGDSVALTLVDDIFVERGTVIAAGELPIEARSFSGRIFWLGRRPLGFGCAQKLRLTTQEASCTVELAGPVLDGATLEPCAGRDDRLESNEMAEVRIRTTRSIALDLYANVRSTGRFVLVDDTDIAGGGIVTDVSSVTPGHSAPMVRVSEYISPEMRELRQGHRGGVVWFTGLPASGKSTLAGALERALFEAGHQVFVLDGDDLRSGLNADLGFSPADRAENIRRTAEVAKLFAEAGIVAVTAFISPYASDRLRARRIIAQSGIDLPFIEVFVDAPLAVCEERDPKGLYAHARAGRIEQFTGVSAPYERPGEPEMTVRTAEHTVEECVSQLLACVLPVLARR